MKALCVHDTHERGDWNPYLIGYGRLGYDILDEEEKNLYNKISSINLDVSNHDEAYAKAKELLDALGFDSDELEKEAQEQQAKENGEGDGEEKEQGVGEGEGKEEASEGEGGDEKKEMQSALAPGVVKYQKDPKEGEVGKHGLHIDYSDMGEYVGVCEPIEGKEIHLKEGHVADSGYAEAIKSIHGGEVLASNVRMLFASMKQVTWEERQRRGRISSKNLWKARRPIYDQDVYKKRVQKLDMSTAVTVLCDFSGSMSGDKAIHASKAGVILHEAIYPVGIPVELLAFSERGAVPYHLIIKDFAERVNDSDVIVDRFSSGVRYMGSNDDGSSILWAHNRLLRRKENRKVLIVLSDGSPASARGGHGGEVRLAKEVIATIQDRSPVEIYGIGIMDTNVKLFYKEYSVINSAEQLEEALLSIVKSKLLNNG